MIAFQKTCWDIRFGSLSLSM